MPRCRQILKSGSQHKIVVNQMEMSTSHVKKIKHFHYDGEYMKQAQLRAAKETAEIKK